jgi:hypothetical protein
VAGLDDAQLDTPYRDGGWTVRQVVHHVADSHMNAYVRIKLALTADAPPVTVYDEAAWARLPDSQLPVEPSLALVDALQPAVGGRAAAVRPGRAGAPLPPPRDGRGAGAHGALDLRLARAAPRGARDRAAGADGVVTRARGGPARRGLARRFAPVSGTPTGFLLFAVWYFRLNAAFLALTLVAALATAAGAGAPAAPGAVALVAAIFAGQVAFLLWTAALLERRRRLGAYLVVGLTALSVVRTLVGRGDLLDLVLPLLSLAVAVGAWRELDADVRATDGRADGRADGSAGGAPA